jgi:ABC-type phosphonate transport system ATPase subunit
VVTQDLSVPRRLGGDLLVLDGGRAAEHGRVDTVLSATYQPCHPSPGERERGMDR